MTARFIDSEDLSAPLLQGGGMEAKSVRFQGAAAG